MAKIDTLYTPFDGSSLGAEWQLTTTNPTSATETGGNLEIESLSGSVLAGVETVAPYDWTNSVLIIEAAASNATAVYLYAVTPSGLAPAFRFDNGASRPSAGFFNVGAYGNLAVGTNGNRFAKLTHDGTNLIWETSSDGITYSTLHTAAASGYGNLTGAELRIVTANASVTTFRIATIGSPPAGSAAGAKAQYRHVQLLMEP